MVIENWYAKSIPAVLKELETNEHGLSAASAAERLREFGANELPKTKPEGLFVIFLRQFESPLIYILLAAAVGVFLLGETADSVIIFVVLLFNAVVGAFQEGRAQNTLRALETFVRTMATGERDGI